MAPSTSLRLESIQLRVRDVPGSVGFYTRRLGFVVRRETSREAQLAVTPGSAPLLILTATDQPPAPADAAGMFHAALLLPNRGSLAAWLRSAATAGVEFDGFSDHGVSEAIYCTDPEGNGLEFYADRPREAWPCANGELAMDTRPLDTERLLAEPAPAAGEPLGGARWGHLHLRVTNLDRSEAHYRTTLGLEVTQRSYPGARFLAADGYHHHLGLNVWGQPRRRQPPDAPGLGAAKFVHSGYPAGARSQDPDGIELQLSPPAP